MWPMLSSFARIVKYRPSRAVVTTTVIAIEAHRRTRDLPDLPDRRELMQQVRLSAHARAGVALRRHCAAVERAVSARDAGRDAAVVTGQRLNRATRRRLRRRQFG